jgi:glycosyltransferase involved in cell wall biosynthesis
MLAVALLATYNEERFIQGCLEHLIAQGVSVYVIDNASTDGTRAIAQGYVGRGVIDVETLPRHGCYTWRPILERKERLAAELEGDWFLHLDADEIRLPPEPGTRLADALARVDAEGFNAVNFMEFTFVPTRETPDHDHPRFAQTMRWYYPYLPSFPNRLNAWKRQDAPVELAWSGGHRVRFPGLKMYPVSFPMKHYLFLSADHARRKYIERTYDAAEMSAGWHRARAGLRPEGIRLQSEQEMRHCGADGRLDPTEPLKKHPLFAQIGHGS